MEDKKARELIMTSLNKNYFVEASAGSGKTTSLVYRMVALIESGVVSVDKICTITFTKAAADEFFVRFQSLLSTRAINLPDDSDKFLGKKTIDSVNKCQEALNNIDLCFLGTIDAFLNMIAHELPNEIKVPSDAEVIDNKKREEFIKFSYEQILTNEDHPLHPYAIRLNEVYPYFAYDIFAATVDTLSSKRNSKIIYDESLIDVNLDEYLAKYKDDLLNIAKSISESTITFDLHSKKGQDRQRLLENIKSFYKLLKHNGYHRHPSIIERLIKDVRNIDIYPSEEVEGTPLEFNKILTKNKKSYVYSDMTLEVLDGVTCLMDNYKHSLVLYLASKALEDINQKLKEAGKFTFYDFLYYAVEAFKLSASTDRVLVDHILSRHSHFLLDESQDTDPMQMKLFFYITGTRKSDDWRQVEPKEGSLFIVGDPKQSIYAFRGANVQAYLKTKEIFNKKNEVLILSDNFRSLPGLKSWFNDAMNAIFEHGEDKLTHNDIPINPNDLKREDNTPIEEGLIGLKDVYKYVVTPSEDPEYVASLIYELVHNKKYRILVKNPQKDAQNPYIYRKINYKDFLIVPRTTDVNKYIQAFDEHHIPMVIEASIPFNNVASLNALIMLSLLMKSPNDKSYLLDVLYEYYHLNENDVLNLVNDDFSFDISDISTLSINDELIKAIIMDLNRLYLLTKDLSFSSMMLIILNDEKLSLLERVDSWNLEYTYFLIEKVKEKEESGNLSTISLFNDYLLTFVLNKSDDNRILRFKNDVDRVKIANLHKVKGLQAPIVILIKPSVMSRDANYYINYHVDPIETHFASLSIKLDNGLSKEIARDHSYDEKTIEKWNEYEQEEKGRLEYVAATRAESLLIISAPTKINSNYYNPWGKLVSHIDDKHLLNINFETELEEEIPSDINYLHPFLDESLYLPSIKHHSPSDIRIKALNNNEDELKEEVKEDATLIGTLIHKLMERIISSHDSYSDKELLIDNILKEYDSDKYHDLLSKVLSKLYQGGFTQKNSSLPSDLLNYLKRAKEVYAELPFSYQKYGVIISGIIDLVYLDNDGYHIIDYKTNQENDVSILEKEYQKQLRNYQEALKEIGIDADAHIYHIDV